MNNKIFVSKPFLPPIEKYIHYVQQVWDNCYLTNNGPLVRELEKKLKAYLGVKHIFFVSNGTIALQLAIKALNLKKTIITTPFSFAATTNAIIWEKCTPVFADIDPSTLCIDPDKIEKLITKETEAILAVHIYGIPCNIKKINILAKKYNLKVIYDAAHAFGTKIGNDSICIFGDISTISFHAVKLFHTGEGGAIITNDDILAKKIALYRNFGLEGDNITYPGINAKNSELHAALGLANFPYIQKLIDKRKLLIQTYDNILKNSTIFRPIIPDNISYNYSYYPIIFNTEKETLHIYKLLQKKNIYAKRYFYPSLNTLSFIKGNSCPISESISKRILCLPLYHDLSLKMIKKIAKIIIQNRMTINRPRQKSLQIHSFKQL
ncbi:DegT/DnrJ/EryC1/StrS family aminotransferase [Patescibacteria group bacterium]|nr:DegT/DnrJ/EryC1/StrS family aminotransferase [Patescibacteria group bacterium]